MKTKLFEFDDRNNYVPTDPMTLRGMERDQTRMVVLDRERRTIKHAFFSEIGHYLRAGDLVILNDSYMTSNTLPFKARGDSCDLILYGYEPDGSCMVETRPNISCSGLQLQEKNHPALICTLLEEYPNSIWKARFEGRDLLIPTLEEFGWRTDDTVPLNPIYWQTRRKDYRSVFATKPGSLEIPSAGLNFTESLLEGLIQKGVEVAYITLHVGATEVLAVRHIEEQDVEEHNVREEYFEVSEDASSKINAALNENRRIIVVGTTVMRAVESVAVADDSEKIRVKPQNGWTGLYIYPGYVFKVATGFVTNLHRSRSSHIVLTSAFAQREFAMRAYQEILEDGKYEFDMFGSSMVIL